MTSEGCTTAMDIKKWRAKRPSATAWEKVDARSAGETLRDRDVHESQQLERSKRQQRRSKTPAHVVAVVTGLLGAMAAWFVYSFLAMSLMNIGGMIDGGLTGDSQSSSPSSGESASYYTKDANPGSDAKPGADCYRPLTQKGWADYKPGCFDSAQDVPVPSWWSGPTAAQEGQKAAPGATPTTAGTNAPAADDAESQPDVTLGESLGSVSLFKLLVSLVMGLLAGSLLGSWLGKQVDRLNIMNDTSDINQHQGDQHISLPEEVQRKFDWFPNAGAHSSVEVSSLISHNMIAQKGLKKVPVVQRATEDVYDEDGELLYHEGEALHDENGELLTKLEPIIDEAFGQALFDVSGVEDPTFRVPYNVSQIPYNRDGSDRAKAGKYATVKDLINADWDLPDYEVQRPSGAYLVDTAPVNTMVLAITRAGKGQGYIEPMLSMWSREKKPSNMVINDPKGELLVKNYVSLVHRGYEPVQFNLINEMKTDIYNPLGMAAEAAREGDATKCAMYVENIADVLIPLDGGEDPVWPNAANNALRRAAFGLIDFYLEEERELRAAAARRGTDPEVLARKLDEMWGKVTMYNTYQLFVQLTSKKVKNPKTVVEEDLKAGVYENDDVGYELDKEEAETKAFLWEGQPEMDMLTLFFNATAALPSNTSRSLVNNANNALRAMATAEKMLASVYGIAITAMSFFTKPTIATLTSGKPSQVVDLGSLSFPRRFGVRFVADYVKRNRLVGLEAVWSAYADPMFTQNLGEDFEHTDVISRQGWARYYFKGVFPTDIGYVKLELVNAQSRMLVRTFWFCFKKGYKLSGNGRHYVTEPVTGRKIVKDGVLREMLPVRIGGTRDGEIESFRFADSTFTSTKLVKNEHERLEQVPTDARAIMQTSMRYGELLKAVFLVTPPHLATYAKLLLVLLKQLVDLNFDQSYMTKSNQKPLYRTRFMLDELGNLQSEGKGIGNFQTMLSIGLGQEQQFTLILQTLQQLRDVYGESVDKIVQGNVSNIIFLKSTDDSMLETLEKMSGTTHKSYTNSKQVTQDLDKIVGGATDARVSYTMSTEKEPLISYNDMAFLADRNSIVFRAGDAPVWNRNQTVLPMMWKLDENNIKHVGHPAYDLKRIPTMSSAMDFDVRMNQPDFTRMLDKRVKQAVYAGEAKSDYMEAYDYKEVDVERLDPDVYSGAVMELIGQMISNRENADPDAAVMVDPADYDPTLILPESSFVENVEVTQAVALGKAAADLRSAMVYAQGQISSEMLVNLDGSARVKALDVQIAEAYKSAQVEMESDSDHFSVVAGNLMSADGRVTYISNTHSARYTQAVQEMNGSIHDPGSSVFADEDVDAADMARISSVEVHAAFYHFLAGLKSWEPLARGEFDRAMAVEMRA